MGTFTDRIKRIFNQKSKPDPAPKPLGKSRMLSTYFLRCKSDKNLFIHPDGSDLFKPVYALKPTPTGAALFTNEMAERLIDHWDGAPIEKISFEDLQKEGGV